ncbi:hypothetical protein SDC9_80196 [bioreactor metagenome]|uniref:Uncharacterized protein n=1 Tax=bioreactor metagenome TaxID=1076179 RepID=A0A644YZ94_9ZZZZ
MIIVGGRGEPIRSRGIKGRRKRAVSLIEIEFADLQLFAVGFEVRAIGQRHVQIGVHAQQQGIAVIFDFRELDRVGQGAFGIAHQRRQREQRLGIVEFRVQPVGVGLVDLNLEVEHIAQRHRAVLMLDFGFTQVLELEAHVFQRNPAVFRRQQNIIIGLRHEQQQLPAGVIIQRFLAHHAIFGRHHAEFPRQTVEQQPVGPQRSAGRPGIGASGLNGIVLIGDLGVVAGQTAIE